MNPRESWKASNKLAFFSFSKLPFKSYFIPVGEEINDLIYSNSGTLLKLHSEIFFEGSLEDLNYYLKYPIFIYRSILIYRNDIQNIT